MTEFSANVNARGTGEVKIDDQSVSSLITGFEIHAKASETPVVKLFLSPTHLTKVNLECMVEWHHENEDMLVAALSELGDARLGVEISRRQNSWHIEILDKSGDVRTYSNRWLTTAIKQAYQAENLISPVFETNLDTMV